MFLLNQLRSSTEENILHFDHFYKNGEIKSNISPPMSYAKWDNCISLSSPKIFIILWISLTNDLSLPAIDLINR